MLRASMRRIEVFVAVAEAGHFGAAAERLGISQPAVSAHVRALEAELRGPPLLERPPGRPPRLTEAGQAFLDSARALLAQARTVAAEARRGRGEAARRVVFACQPHLANFLLPAALAGFAREAPQVELVVRSGGRESVPEQVLSGGADLGGMLGHPGTDRLSWRRIGQEPYIVVAAPGHPLATRRRIPPAELETHSFVRGPRTALLSREIDRAAAAIGLAHMRVAARATEYNMSRALVMAGIGLLWTPRTPAVADLRDGCLVALNLDAPPVLIDIGLVWPAGRNLVGPTAALAAWLARQAPLAAA